MSHSSLNHWNSYFMTSLLSCLSDNNQADVIEAVNSTLRYLYDMLNIDNPYFKQMVDQIYPTDLQFNKVTEAHVLDLNSSITNGKISSKIDDQQDSFKWK